MFLKIGIYIYAILSIMFFLKGLFFMKIQTPNKADLIKAFGFESLVAGIGLFIAVAGHCLGWSYYLLFTGLVILVAELYILYKLFINGKKNGKKKKRK